MKVLFTHGYYIEEDPKEQLIMRPYPPLGILYLSAWLEEHGVANEVYDSTFSNKKEQYAYLLEEQPAVIAIYTNLMTKLNVIELVEFIKGQEQLKDAVVVLGGPDVSYNIMNYLATGADVAVIGEGEQTMLEIVQTVQKGNRTQFGHINGIAYNDPEHGLIRTLDRHRIRPVDSLPFPNRHKIPIHKYLDAWKTHHGQSALSVSTQRGCPYTCKWCSTAVYGQSYRRRSPKSVVDEMELLQKEYQPDTLWFVDDVFTVSHKWLAGFAEEVNTRNIKIPFECITRADRMTDEVIDLLKEAGCFRVWIGAESGSQKIIDAMDRRVDVVRVQDMIIAAQAKGIQAGTFIMLGYPGETEEDIQQTINHLKRSNPDLFTITVAYPIKGTSLYQEVDALRLEDLDWNSTTDRDIEFQRTYPRKYYDFAVRWVVNSVNLNKLRLKGQTASLSAAKLATKVAFARLGMAYCRIFLKQPKPLWNSSDQLPANVESTI
ncbi:MAG: radical SAM protein [Bacteroidota bacterium]